MTIFSLYQKYKDRWWALPLILPVILLPLARLTTTYTQIQGNVVVLYYMPLALFLALMMFYGMAAVPGIVVALMLRYYTEIGGYETGITVAHFLIPLTLSWGGISGL